MQALCKWENLSNLRITFKVDGYVVNENHICKDDTQITNRSWNKTVYDTKINDCQQTMFEVQIFKNAERLYKKPKLPSIGVN